MKNNGTTTLMGIGIATLIGFCATSVAIFIIPQLLIEVAERSDQFWQRVLWTEFLALLIWLYIGGFFSLVSPRYRAVQGLGAILPSIGIVIICYAVISFTIMMVASYFPQLRPIHYASQIDRFAGLIVIAVFLYFSWRTGIAGAEPIPERILSPKQLIILLQQLEMAITRDVKSAVESENVALLVAMGGSLRKLRETISYSMPHVGALGTNIKYAEFSSKIAHLCADISAVNLKTDIKERIHPQKADDLVYEAIYIAQSLRTG